MKKFFFISLMVLCLLVTGVLAAFAEDGASDAAAAASDAGFGASLAVTASELAAWGEESKSRALEAEPENDPTAEEADMESGIMYLYPFATVYADGTEMNADTHLNSVVVSEPEEAPFRSLALSMTPEEVMALFPNNNPEQAGTRNGAVLYLQENDDGSIRFGRVFRDGQRVQALQYGELTPAGDMFHLASVTCNFNEALLSGFAVAGFDAASAALYTREDRDELALELNALAAVTDYKVVKTSRNGLDLTAFGPEDLVFSDLDFLALQPEDLPGTPESETMDNDDGTSLIRVDGDGYVAVFTADADGKTSIVSLSIESDSLEGPRGVRLGDTFHEDYQRFRSEGRGTDENLFEVLYGAENEVPRGTAQFGGLDGITLRYVTAVPDGREAELLLRYETNTLNEIILYIR